MGLPTSTEGPIGSHAPVTSTRIAAIEACIIGMKHDSIEPVLNVPVFISNGTYLSSGAGSYFRSAGVGFCVYDIGAIAGTRYTKVTYDVFGTGGGVVQMSFNPHLAGGVEGPGANEGFTPPSGVWTSGHAVILVPPHTALPGESITVEFSFITADMRIRNVRVARDRL